MVRFSEIQQFPNFLELFPGNLRTICPRFENFGNFGRMVSAPCLDKHLTAFVVHLHDKSREVYIKTRSPPAALPFKRQVTIKWSIMSLKIIRTRVYDNRIVNKLINHKAQKSKPPRWINIAIYM